MMRDIKSGFISQKEENKFWIDDQYEYKNSLCSVY